MEKLFDFKLNTSYLTSKAFVDLEISTFQSALHYIHQLPYGRNTDRSDYNLVLKEQIGTCSTKHALLKQLAIDNKQDNVKLYLSIYKMNGLNTSGIASVLQQYNLDYIPEAHTYLKIEDRIVDVTRTDSSSHSFTDSILHEEVILPYQIGKYKINYHQNYLKHWLKSVKITYTLEEIWTIREACINALNQKT
ncbi:hypothetical protein [Olleya sp. YS]|uniref:hypothetical protein n=1 Tax=Olleya sp. YS TaxID=3028318 RepID=UPI0024342643|nr:hypothetical protein [Olleya sp. YS]WGD34403.1 hypothetical protein Ollyesu_11510 [Olleya sp. YS]